MWDSTWQEWDCAWRQIDRIDKKDPPSWKLADVVITAGLRGILFPSLRHAGGTNLVIFPANLVDRDKAVGSRFRSPATARPVVLVLSHRLSLWSQRDNARSRHLVLNDIVLVFPVSRAG
ncbi:RES domain-containing protein [Mesorhizobium sp. M6A.T.Ce.TU.002.03.1.1]|nr:RES domain-containing protein [Mesorhizobium sp. M6A.T.Cr.TU.016.01.1.1]RUU46688.1 RES domain-containing protein [Mesorhizobium sp. M6A.T.Ce.TU.002.03.1.1]RWP76832.1 MAG: RES domain-containing protein [Mesorhizobium sp.]